MAENFPTLLNDTEELKTKTNEIGDFGEKFACDYIARKGYELISQNFKVPVGRNRKGVQITGEIDIVAKDGNTLCFIEVKTRSSDEYASPFTAINVRKQRQITRTARVYRKLFDQKNSQFRYDAISVVLNGNKAPKVELIKGFWNENKFKKRYWLSDF